MPPDYATQEDEDSSTLEVKNTNHKREHEFAGGEVVNVSKDWHHDKQSFPRMKFTKRLSGLLSVTARVFSGKPKLFTCLDVHTFRLEKAKLVICVD